MERSGPQPLGSKLKSEGVLCNGLEDNLAKKEEEEKEEEGASNDGKRRTIITP